MLFSRILLSRVVYIHPKRGKHKTSNVTKNHRKNAQPVGYVTLSLILRIKGVQIMMVLFTVCLFDGTSKFPKRLGERGRHERVVFLLINSLASYRLSAPFFSKACLESLHCGWSIMIAEF